MILLETSSYLPLIWTTPYTRSVVSLMTRHQEGHGFALQRDCVAEAAGYMAFKDDWRYHPAMRMRRLVEGLTDNELATMGHPSTAVQLLLGGNIWPQAQYLNFVRHSTFFFADLLDGLSWEDPRRALLALAALIEERVEAFRCLFQQHLTASALELPTEAILPYWGRWYLPRPLPTFRIQVLDDPRPYNMTADKLRDIYHYDCAVNHTPTPTMMIVANTGFTRNVKGSFSELALPILCAETVSASILS